MKEVFTEEQIECIVDMIENGDFSQETSDVEFDGRLTYIRVDEDGDGSIQAYFGCVEDGPRYSIPSPSVTHTVNVGDYTFTCEEIYDNGFGRWECDEYDANESRIQDALNENCETASPEYPDAYESFENDWTDEEVIDEIEGDLSSDDYIDIDGEIYAINGSVEEFLEEYFDGDKEAIESCDYTELTRRELAEKLAEGIDFHY